MSDCDHKSCGSTEKAWLPYYYQGRARGLKPHPFCAECGLVKNLSSDRPREIGFFLNVLAELGKHYKIAAVQTRLMVLEMERQAMDDGYGMDRMQQEELFVDIAVRMLNVPERALRELL
ncbi:MAG: hypothetical protein HPY61_06990 [Methanotrichaceae archaeon]|nr:hypothetical protein [Methanotrichaceae archaeon]